MNGSHDKGDGTTCTIVAHDNVSRVDYPPSFNTTEHYYLILLKSPSYFGFLFYFFIHCTGKEETRQHRRYPRPHAGSWKTFPLTAGERDSMRLIVFATVLCERLP